MQRALWRPAMRGRALTTIVTLALCLGSICPVLVQSAQTSRDYVAYRADSTSTPGKREELLKKAPTAGLKPVKDGALERAGLWVFEIEDAALAASNAASLFKEMKRVPVNEFRGVLSVPTGNYYLRFAVGVSSTTARKRVEALGFKVLTPSVDGGTLLVVEGTGDARDRQRELNRLKKLDQILYVAPNDIPLRVPVRDQ